MQHRTESHTRRAVLRSGARQTVTPIKSGLASAIAMALIGSCSSSAHAGAAVGSRYAELVRAGAYAVTQNAASVPGNVKFFTGGLDTMPVTVNTGANEGAAFDPAGTLYQNADSDSVIGIRVLGQAASKAEGDAYTPTENRMIGSSPGKGLTHIPVGHLLVSADVTDAAADMKIFSASAGMDAAPLYSVDTEAPVWDVFYQKDVDRLYAALTNGKLAIFDEFSKAPDAAPDRTVTPVDHVGRQVSVNFHGVFVEGNSVVVSDVGATDSPTDGALFTFVDNGSLAGKTRNFKRVAGPATSLGNPVDVMLDGDTAIVAEKSNDLLLVFKYVSTLSGNVSPDWSTPFVKPESVEFSVMADKMIVDESDIDSATMLKHIFVSLNPGIVQDDGSGMANNSDVGAIRFLDADLNHVGAFDAGFVMGDPGAQMFRTLENLQTDAAGNAYVVFDTNDGSMVSDRGIVVLHQLSNRDGDGFNKNRDRVIQSVTAGLTSPKGVEIVNSLGKMIVADVGNDGTPPSLQVYSLEAGAGVEPVFTVADTGAAAIWDMDYDPATDRLFAAGTAGDILVYDNFFASAASAVPTRSIQPTSAGKSSNIHGIVHVASTDQIIASDVGDAADSNDGKLYVIDSAMTAYGSVTPKVTIAGRASRLGNPVDIAFDGSAVYIAEKSNDALLVYNDVLSLSGFPRHAPDRSVALTKPESVSIVPNNSYY